MILKLLIIGIAANVCLAGKSGIVRPCRLNDRKCIADNLKANSRCNPRVAGYVPSKYTLKNMRFDAPFFNASFIDNVMTVRNHDRCTVSEFFYNVKKDTAVLSIDCPRMDFECDRTLIQHASKKEDSQYHYHIRGEYPLIRFTTNLKHADKMDMCSAFVFADVTALPIFKVNPLDKPTGKFLSRDLTVLNIFERESFFFRAPFLMRYFINSYICNFGCN